jgi:hypothetical protein
MAGPDALRKRHLDLLRTLSDKGDGGTLLNSDNPLFAITGRAARNVVECLNDLYVQDLIERVPETSEGWFRITAAGRRRLTRR